MSFETEARYDYDPAWLTDTSYTTLFERWRLTLVVSVSGVSNVIRKGYGEVRRMSIWHKTGDCPVKEASVVIAVSSPHRRAALEACAWAIDELKATVPIWKKEFFEGGEV